MARHRRPGRRPWLVQRPILLVVLGLLMANLLMFVFFVGSMSLFHRHAEVLDERTVQDCVNAAALEHDVHLGHEPAAEFDGAFVLRLSANGISVRCHYSLPAEDEAVPVIEQVTVVSR